MKGSSGHHGPPVPSSWQEFKTPDGRSYYYNASTKVTQWTKPPDLMSPVERALASQPWVEYTADGGRKYWHNKETQQSSWEMPDAYRFALGIPSTPSALPTPISSSSATGSKSGFLPAPYDRNNPDTSIVAQQNLFTIDNRSEAFATSGGDIEYATSEESEAAFVKLLKRSGVQPHWTWPQTIRAVVKDPQYRAIKDPRDRKDAFEKYCRDMIIEDREKAQERLTKLRAGFTTMLRRHPEIKHFTRWKTARPIIEGEIIFRSTGDENERRQFFDDYISDLRKSHTEHETAIRKQAMDGLIEMLPQLNLEPYTRWSDTQSIISSTPPFQNDDKYQALSHFDLLTVFQNHMKAVERTFNDSKQQQKNRKLRRERINRDGFRALLSDLQSSGKIKAGTRWKEVFPLLEPDNRYQSMIGQSGSTPMELFWDAVEEEERALRVTRNDILDVMDDRRFEFSPKTTFPEFAALLEGDHRTAALDTEIMRIIFDRLQERKSKPSEEDRHVEKQQRRANEEFRSHLKRLEPPISSYDTYERVRPRIANSDEFKGVASEDVRRGIFEKYIRRLKDREEESSIRRHRDRQSYRDRDGERDRDGDREKDRGRERDKGHDRERERERGDRSRRSSRYDRSSRSPEPDAYEADRRKAIAERERNYRKSGMAETLFSDRRESGSYRERDKDRHRDFERDRRDRSDRDRRGYDNFYRSRDDLYDRHRERRDLDDRPDTSYRRRADRPIEELPYGDERPSGRRRRADDDKDSRESKRPRRERTVRERTPRPDSHPKPKSPNSSLRKEPSGVHSGSEEGEIEED